jgi:hypothetical protein
MTIVEQICLNRLWETAIHKFLLKRVDPRGNYFTNQQNNHQVVRIPTDYYFFPCSKSTQSILCFHPQRFIVWEVIYAYGTFYPTTLNGSFIGMAMWCTQSIMMARHERLKNMVEIVCIMKTH